MSHQTATVNVRGHEFSADYLVTSGKLPTVIRLWLDGHPEDVLRIIDDDTLLLIRVECRKRQSEQEAYIAHAIDSERLES